MPSRSTVPVRHGRHGVLVAEASIVATAAAIGTAWNQNEPVTKMREAASLNGADPRIAAIG